MNFAPSEDLVQPSSGTDQTSDEEISGAGASVPGGLKESSSWHTAYDSPDQVERRRAEIPGKLRKLGLADVTRNATILDLCCGNGETLDALYGMGFRNLSGSDITVTPGLIANPRFVTHVGDAAALDFPDESLDWILIVHALHHLGPAEHIDEVLKECDRVLKPGGRIAVLDFPNSPQIQLAFWFFRQKLFLVSSYLKYFGGLIQEEWHFLKPYLQEWKSVRALLHHGRFEVERFRQEFFYYYLTLRKPPSAARIRVEFDEKVQM
jgi:ubiquinone/menaquinone biosynthesis C-methylase UbiE